MRLVLLAPFVVSVTASVTASAERRAVTLGDALAAARAAPAARVPGHEIAAAEANIGAAAAWPRPTVVIATNRLTARLVTGATVPLPVFGTIGAARRQAAAEADVVRAEAELVRRQLRHNVVVAWVQLARADGEVVSTSIAAQHEAELELIAKGRLAAGVGGDLDVTVASAARARADVAAAAAQQGEDAASAELAGLLGWDPERPLRAEGVPVTGDAVDLEALRARLLQHPERAAALRRIDVANATLDHVLADRWPLLALEGEVLFRDPTLPGDGTDARIGVALEVPVFAHLGDRARSARATEAAQRGRLAVTENELGAGLVASYRRWQAANERLRALERDVAPAQERAAALSAQAFREGARDLAFALQAERDLTAVHAEINSARADAAIAFADLQLAVGEEVGSAR